MGFAGYFLIVADFIRWARENGVPVGPGRGSGAGSLVAYSLGVTDLDPLAHDLLFERFLNPERVSMPDFDIDFCQEGRDRVIDYVKQKYGAQVCLIGNIDLDYTLTLGTEEEVEREVRDRIEKVGRGGGYIISSANSITNYCKLENIRAMARTVEKYRRYAG